MAPFVDIILRGLALSGQAVAIGGVLFALLVWRDADAEGARPRLWGLVALGATVVAVAQTLALVVLAASLEPPSGAVLAATQYFRATLARVLAALALVVAAVAVRRAPRVGLWWPLLLAGVVALAVSAAWTSHGAARPGDRGIVLALDGLHQLAASVWIGGLVHLVVLRRYVSPDAEPALLRRFSTLALVAVGALVAGGAGLTIVYVDGPRGLIGTAYGLMVLTKLVLLGGLLVLGALNLVAVRRRRQAESPSPLRLWRFVEVEVGIGLTVLFAAASLTSLPPASDVVADRATPAEVLTRFTPRWPSLTSPPVEALPVDRETPRTDADRAWSEYNHHVSGLFVLAMGVLSLVSVTGARWAGHWPLLFLGLGGFMLVRNDPEAWPLGPQGFWASMAAPEVFQHRVFVLLVAVFGLFEWLVRTGRVHAPRAALIFPLLCAVGGGLLLTHSHASLNLKSEFLMELTHAPLGVLGLAVGWGRWLELRLPPPGDRLPGWLSASAMVAVGALLLLYRES